jgi:hypothetical protein
MPDRILRDGGDLAGPQIRQSRRVVAGWKRARGQELGCLK